MKLLLDQGLPRSAVGELATRGIAGIHVGELGLAAAEDSVILDEARRQAAIVVTLDADFHAILARTGAANPSVIRIRIEGLGGAQLAQLLEHVVQAAAADLAVGAAVSVTTPNLVRIRRLPLA
jgi:predicted nuclease of predicted toxin-antitoxin system